MAASAIKVGDGTSRNGRLSVENLASVGSTPITVGAQSQLGFSPGTGNTITPNLATITQGSGAIRAQTGTVDFGTNILSGSTVAPVTVAGLQHSIITGSNNFTDPNTRTDIRLGPTSATTPNQEGTFGKNDGFGQINATQVYTGQFFDADGIVAFAEHYDDTVLLIIDGRDAAQQHCLNVQTSSPDDDAATPGLQTNIGAGNAGWHSFELRLSQGSGGVGVLVIRVALIGRSAASALASTRIPVRRLQMPRCSPTTSRCSITAA